MSTVINVSLSIDLSITVIGMNHDYPLNAHRS